MITPDQIHEGDLVEVILPDREREFFIVAKVTPRLDGTVSYDCIGDPENEDS
jgi:hypothetical protein